MSDVAWPDEDVDVQRVQPYKALKDYICPGCLGTIMRGQGHFVIIPKHAPDLRRHWHYACWENRFRRR